MSLPRSLFKKVRRFEKSTPPPVVAVVTNIRCAGDSGDSSDSDDLSVDSGKFGDSDN